MNQEFDILDFSANLLEFSPRLGLNERKTAEFLISVLKGNNVAYAVQEFETAIPVSKKTWLEADGKKIDCLNSCFTSGQIDDKKSLVSSLTPSRLFLEYPNINFNPECKAISLGNFYFAPAFAISRIDLPKILRARKVKGETVVEPYNYSAWNILVGNAENPNSIVFAHYDSLETGACDNASGVGVLMQIILKQPGFLNKNLFVFSANEELSYDKPTYWGHGFRAFEETNEGIMASAKRLIAVDCVGNGKNHFDADEQMIYLGFPVKKADGWKDKILVLCGDLKKENKVYHSRLDDKTQLNKISLSGAADLLAKELFKFSF